MMSIAVEAPFTSAFGLQEPWNDSIADLNTIKRRTDFEVKYKAIKLPCPGCGVDEQGGASATAKRWPPIDASGLPRPSKFCWARFPGHFAVAWRLANTLRERLPGAVRGRFDGRSNAYIDDMNGSCQQIKLAARGLRIVVNFVAIA